MALSRFEGYKNRRRQAIRCKKESASMTLANTKNLPEQSTSLCRRGLVSKWPRVKLLDRIVALCQNGLVSNITPIRIPCSASVELIRRSVLSPYFLLMPLTRARQQNMMQ